jgi:predicted nucleic acid-binding Zn ribbon protein
VPDEEPDRPTAHDTKVKDSRARAESTISDTCFIFSGFYVMDFRGQNYKNNPQNKPFGRFFGAKIYNLF